MKTFASELSPASRRLLRILTAVASSLITVFIVADPSIHSAGLRRFGQATETIAAAPIPFATTFTVNSVNDNADANVGDGHCDTDGNLANGDQCTLRAAIQEGAFSNQGHSINFSLPAGSVITLNTALPSFSHDVSIAGPGSRQLTIQRSTAGGTPSFRIFNFIPISGNFTNSVSGLTILNGTNSCLVSQSPVVTTLTDMTFRGCTGVNGGAISNGGTMTLTDSTIDGNTASGAGGGIFNNGGFLNGDGILNLVRTTVSNNSADAQGGGIANSASLGPNSGGSIVTLTNSTISGNTATGVATAGDGGLTNMSSGTTINLNSSTVTANTAGANTTGGIGNVNGATVNIANSIVAKNTGGFGDVRGVFNSQGYNLIGQSAAGGLNNGLGRIKSLPAGVTCNAMKFAGLMSQPRSSSRSNFSRAGILSNGSTKLDMATGRGHQRSVARINFRCR